MRALAYADISQLAAIDHDEEAMQIQLRPGEPWHKVFVGRVPKAPSCDEPLVEIELYDLHARGYAESRPSSLVGPLCPICFTPAELAESVRLAGLDRISKIPDSSNNGDHR